MQQRFFIQMIWILRMDEHVAKMTVQCNNYFANDLNIAKRQVECNNFSSSNDLYPKDGWTCCKKDGPIGQLFCT